jgi:hypothetical protein
MNDPLNDAATAAEQARSRLMGTVDLAKDRLHPRTLTQEAVVRAKERVSKAAERSVEAVKSRPDLIVGALAATTLVLLRKPLINLFKAFSKESDNG